MQDITIYIVNATCWRIRINCHQNESQGDPEMPCHINITCLSLCGIMVTACASSPPCQFLPCSPQIEYGKPCCREAKSTCCKPLRLSNAGLNSVWASTQLWPTQPSRSFSKSTHCGHLACVSDWSHLYQCRSLLNVAHTAAAPEQTWQSCCADLKAGLCQQLLDGVHHKVLRYIEL